MFRKSFLFKTFGVAKLYLRTADYTTKQCCGVYEIISGSGRKSYKIFLDDKEMLDYLKKNKDKKCTNNKALFRASEYKDFPNTKAVTFISSWIKTFDLLIKLLECL